MIVRCVGALDQRIDRVIVVTAHVDRTATNAQRGYAMSRCKEKLLELYPDARPSSFDIGEHDDVLRPVHHPNRGTSGAVRVGAFPDPHPEQT